MSVNELPKVVVKDANSGVSPGWVRFSLPFSRGVFFSAPLSLVNEDDQAIMLQTRPLAFWPDGSLRWLDCQAYVESPGEWTVAQGQGVEPSHPVQCRQTDQDIQLDNGLISVELSANGSSPIRRICFEGKDVLNEEGGIESQIAASRTGNLFSSANAQTRSLKILQAGPVRSVVEICGKHGDGEGGGIVDWTLHVEMIAGLRQIILKHTFTHADPGIDLHSLGKISLVTRWRSPKTVRRHFRQNHFGMTWVPREITTPQSVNIRADGTSGRVFLDDTACLDDPTEYPRFMPPSNDISPYLGLNIPGGWVTLCCDDFREMAPTGLSSEGNDLTLGIWPAWAGLLELPQGRSRQTVCRLLFTPGDTPPAGGEISSRLRASRDNVEVSLSEDVYENAGEFFADELLPRHSDDKTADQYLATLATLPTVMGFWDLGDTIDPGYSGTYAGIGRLERLESPPLYFQIGKYFRVAPWASTLLFEPVWANNEYDAMIALAREYIRGGKTQDLWDRMRFFARHAIEVDFVHYSDHPELHHGTPAHSAKHGAATAYPSHLWCEGLLAYYCLSGDDDALDVAIKQGEFILDFFTDPPRREKIWRFNRELGWGLLYLATLGDMTGQQRFLDLAGELAVMLTAEPLTEDLVEQMTVYSFGFASIALGVEALWRITRSVDLASWLTQTAGTVGDALSRGVEPVNLGMTVNYFTAAYAVSGETKYLKMVRPVVREILDGPERMMPQLFVKPVAMLYRGLSRYFRYMQDARLEL